VTAPAQLSLDFDHRPALGGEDFLVAPCNADAVSWLDRWPLWPGPGLVLVGPAACGKTHLANVFLAQSGAQGLTAAALADTDPVALADMAPASVVDDADAVAAAGGEEALLHLYNAVAAAGRGLLLTARSAPARWPIGLRDLKSRLNALPTVEIGPPDDALISAVLVKQFADRQLRVDADVISYLTARMERSFDAARMLVTAVDRAALASGRNITVPLVGGVLADLQQS